MKIDIYAHIVPEKYMQAVAKKNSKYLDAGELRSRPIRDIDVRLELMDRYPDIMQVLTIANPPLEGFVSPADSPDLATLANDELAEILAKYPNRFVAAVGCMPMNNMDAALKEAERAITKLHFSGVHVCTRINGQPLDLPQFKPLYALMAKYDLPIWIHPLNYDILDSDNGCFSWPFETSTAMFHLVKSGVFNDHPNIKFITHHCGGMVPFFEQRIRRSLASIMFNPEEQFRKFYNDTAVYGSTPALMCGYSFFGPERLLFGTDAPLGAGGGLTYETMASVERMSIPEAEKEKIFLWNAIRLLKLSI
jgi:uncharacterized protein